MGNDGGSIPKRRELVKEAAQKPTASQAKETLQEHQEYAWTNCPLSHQPLKSPVVSDYAGKLYNKDAILEYLLPEGDGSLGMTKADCEAVLKGRVKGLKDVVEVKFHTEEGEEERSASAQRGERSGKKVQRWVCPITNKALGPNVKAVYLVPCGHAFADAAIKQTAGDKCLQCNEAYNSENVVSILPTTPADLDRSSARISKLKDQGLTHSLKSIASKTKKKKKHADPAAIEGTPVSETATDVAALSVGKALSDAPPTSKSLKRTAAGIKDSVTATLTAKVLAEEERKAKVRKLDPSDNLKSLFSSSTSQTPKARNGDFMTRGFSIPAGAKHP